MAKPKEIPGLDCGAEAFEGARRVLLARFEEMCEYRAAALDGGDIEGVHDMRVASRRLRSALRDFTPLLRRGKRLDAAGDALRRLADALGTVRDEDVAIHALEKLREEAPPETHAGLEEYVAERRERRGRAELSDVLEERAVEEARRLLARAVESKGRGSKKAEGAGADFGAALCRIVAGLWRELAELSPSLYRPNKSKRLHDMRIAAKRLRYALELLSYCERGGEPKELASEVADLQGELGDLHDCDVWTDDLSGRLRQREDLSADRRHASVWLLGHFAEKRARHYVAALNLWHAWEVGGFAARLAACLEVAKEDKAEASEPERATGEALPEPAA
jgi:CHAD domain-containing protein